MQSFGDLTPKEGKLMYRRSYTWWLAAWVLWVQYETWGVGTITHERSWSPEAAYPGDSHSKCIEDMRTLAGRFVEGEKSESNVKSVKRVTLIGKREAVTTEFNNGGSLRRLYVCFPDTVKPQ